MSAASWATAVDLFAGAGGFTAGAPQAGVRVLWAANHWEAAVQVHADNHPDTEHSCQDLQQADWSRVPAHDILLASPACQGHSRARGTDRPHHDATRSTAWAVVSCAEFHQPRVIVVENVPEFCRWHQYPGTYRSHFDICCAKRQLAVRNGAETIDRRQLGLVLKERKEAARDE